jgi:aminoglycoside/choline kinase family phosphotransferase
VNRDEEIRGFIEAHGYGGASIAELAQDASFRRYWRLTDGPRSAVLMDAPPASEDVRPFLAMRALLRAAGLSVPEVLASAPDAGLLLLEDFGDTLFPAAMQRESLETLYDAATDALAVLGAAVSVEHPVAGGMRRWGPEAMAQATAATFLDWWWPAMLGGEPSRAVREDFEAAMRAMLAPLDDQPQGLVHRDYFAGNLFWLGRREGVRRVGVIDFQDASIGSTAYDLVSLVQDARRDLPAELTPRAMARLLAARPVLDPEAFEAAFAICAAQRHLRVACLWVRLDRRDGKPGYLRHGPRCWALLEQALAHPATAPLAAFLDAHVPMTMRATPESASA